MGEESKIIEKWEVNPKNLEKMGSKLFNPKRWL